MGSSLVTSGSVSSDGVFFVDKTLLLNQLVVRGAERVSFIRGNRKCASGG